MKKDSDEKIREPIVEGLFYPEDPEKLCGMIKDFADARAEPPGKAFAVVSPHASYEKCGICLAAAFRAASLRKVRRAVLIGPVHRDEEEGLILPESTKFRTPLGIVQVDKTGIESVLSCGTKIVQNDIPHLEEHCLEVQLPFLQYFFPDAVIVPILIGKTTSATVRMLTSALHVAFGEEKESTVFIVTTNFSAKTEIEKAEAEADEIIRLVLEKNYKELIEGKITGRFSSCGLGGLAAVMAMPGASGAARLLEKASSKSEEIGGKGVEYAAFSISEI